MSNDLMSIIRKVMGKEFSALWLIIVAAFTLGGTWYTLPQSVKADCLKEADCRYVRLDNHVLMEKVRDERDKKIMMMLRFLYEKSGGKMYEN